MGSTHTPSGVLYGTANNGGAAGFGTVFNLTAPISASSFAVLYTFGGPPGDGANPQASMITDATGALYGTTLSGGQSNAGTVFKLTPVAGGTWTETVLYSFTGGNDGRWPTSNLLFDASGALYGVTQFGGLNNSGTVFKLTPPSTVGAGWTETVLHAFAGGSDGAGPLAGLIFDGSGALYGTTPTGGANNQGTIFKLTPPAAAGGAWTESILWNFTGGNDGSFPGNGGLVADTSGALYGTTYQGGAYGGGTIYQSPSGDFIKDCIAFAA
jgi:uncharacterized repeat protein (TIGR03803 family)